MAYFKIMKISNGEVYVGGDRDAKWTTDKPGQCDLLLLSKGQEPLRGRINQSDKAKSICELWVRDGVLSEMFRP